jgi:hypothetical protein
MVSGQLWTEEWTIHIFGKGAVLQTGPETDVKLQHAIRDGWNVVRHGNVTVSMTFGGFSVAVG